MTPSKNCIDLIKKFEGLRLEAYQCSAKVWTIGYGSTMYPDGTKVKKGDTCTLAESEQYLSEDVRKRSANVLALLPPTIQQHQFDALVSFAYNLGIGALRGSTLLKKVKVNPLDATIANFVVIDGAPVVGSCEFLKWVKAGGVVLKGLVLRRAAEALMYQGK